MCAKTYLCVSFFFVPRMRAERNVNMLKRVSLVIAALALLLIAGCSKPPEAEMQAAQAAIDAARAAEAEQYVPAVFRMASDSLNAANAAKQEQDSKFALFRSYGKSKEMFIRAKALADNAASEAAAEKERVRVQVEGLITQAQAAIDSANAALAKAPKGKGNKAEIELIKNDLAGLGAQFEDAKNNFTAGKYLVARSKVEAVIQKANSIINEIAMAAAKKK
jgi:hypothetical protein